MRIQELIGFCIIESEHKKSQGRLTMGLAFLSTLTQAAIFHQSPPTLLALSLLLMAMQMGLVGLSSSSRLFVKPAPCDWVGPRSTLQIKATHSLSWGKGGHISVYPVSEHQCRAKTMLKCSSIVLVSSFVRLTNEVHGDTGWERRSARQRMLRLQAGAPGKG